MQEDKLFRKGDYISFVEKPWKKLTDINLTLGIILFLISLFTMLVEFWMGIVFLILGIILLISAIIYLHVNISEKRKLEHLKKNGRCYRGRIIRIIPVNFFKFGYSISARVECSFKKDEYIETVISGIYLLYHAKDTEDNLEARVYMDILNNYVIELFRKEPVKVFF